MATTWLIFIILIGRDIMASTSQVRSPGIDGSPARSPGVGGSPARSPGVGGSPARRRERFYSSPRQVPDISLVYRMVNFPGQVEAFCYSGQQDPQITAETLPSYATNPTIVGYGQKKQVSWASGEAAGGLVCYDPYDRRYNVLAPFIDHRAPLVPDFLSLTLGKDEDLHLTFTTWNPQRHVMWQKEPIMTTEWQEATLDFQSQLIIPAGQLSGSGLYSVTPYTSTLTPDVKRSDIGTFSLLVRRCPHHQFGSDCSGWCPDCMNGGVCDEVSGQCVCPPGLSGHLCHTRCTSYGIGQTCFLRLPDYQGLQVCLAAPYGCHCSPGYQGLWCDKGCDRGRWGADCSQTCHHCRGNCDSVDGSCYNGAAPCAGGDMGLPRLRTPPRITYMNEDSALVTFQEWDPSYDDGHLTQGAALSYVLRLLVDGRERKRALVTPPTARLTDLQPRTRYDVQVLLRVRVGGEFCEADGSGRERVHTATFTTTCPNKPPMPRGIKISKVTSSSLLVTWQTPPYMQDCDLVSVVELQEDQSKTEWVSGTELWVSDLEPYSDYSIVLWTYQKSTDTWSDATAATRTRTLPRRPGRVTRVRLEEEATSLTVKWDAPHDQPPTGRLHKYEIRWRKKTGGRWTITEVAGHINSYTIQNLTANTEYSVQVRAKNADVGDWGPYAEESATTKEGKPSVPRDLRVVSVTQTEIVVQWQEPELTYLAISYSISAQGVEAPKNQTLTTHYTTTKISGLKAGQQYIVRVAACTRNLCGHAADLTTWTKPAPPKPIKEMEWQDASEPTIRLPVFATFPVWQWIVVADAQEPLTKDRAKAIAVSEAPQDYSTNLSMWVAASLYQDGRNITAEFVVGDNKTYGSFHNRPLEHDRRYKLTVATESRAGHHREFYVSKPRVIPGSSAVFRGVLLACLLPLLLLATLLAGIIWWRRVRHKPGQVETCPMTVHLYNGFEESDTAPDGSQNTEAAEVHCPEIDHQGNLPVVAAAEAEYINATRSVPRAQVEAFLARAIHSPDTEKEFMSVPARMPKSCSDGERKENRRKNRYNNNLPYNETRVKLACLPEQPFSDYINANYVQGHSHPNAFIATQGPKDYNANTVGDFWRMIWESDTYSIVMLTNLMENGRVKVAQYWPEEEPLLKDGIQVTLVSTDTKMDFIIRTLQVSKNGQVRDVKQYHYTAWPDHGVPQNPFGLTQMLNHLMKSYTKGPITVHCSAGIGRTGCIILTLLVLDQLNTSGYMDALQALVTLRKGRSRLVENTTQYVFCHKLLQEILTGTKTSYLCGVFIQEVARLRLPQPHSDASLIQQQFKKLKDLPKDLTYTFAKNPVCAKFNRNPNIVPADSKMVLLQSLGGGLENQYINLVSVNSMEHKDAYLAGEHPQGHSLGNMWRMVYERRVPVWVLLHSFPDDLPEYPEVVPRKQPLVVGGLSLTLKDEVSFKNFVEHHVEIKVPTSFVAAAHKCVVLKMKGWPHTAPLPATPEPLLAVIDKAKFIAARKGCMLFTCKDGVEGCGLAVAMLQVEDRINLLQEVDIYRSVLSVIYDRPQFINSVEQYDFLHTATLDYLKTNQHYSNFV